MGSEIAAPNVSEIHIDFLLEEEFIVNPDFLRRFTETIGIHDSSMSVESVSRSVGDAHGEADLVVVCRSSENDGQRTAILIEDKIRAEFQPGQPERYMERGKAGVSENKWDRFRTCLVAPEWYLSKDGAKGFHHVVALEKISDWLAKSEPARHEFKARVITEAIRKAESSGGALLVDGDVTGFRRGYYSYFKGFFADRMLDADMNPPPPKGVYKGELWFKMKSRLLPKGAYIHHKAPWGYVDLTFPHTNADLLKIAEPWLEDGMTIIQTTKSAAIRLAVLPIQQFGNFEEERAVVEQGLLCAERLLRFYGRERARLDPILTKASTALAK